MFVRLMSLVGVLVVVVRPFRSNGRVRIMSIVHGLSPIPIPTVHCAYTPEEHAENYNGRCVGRET